MQIYKNIVKFLPPALAANSEKFLQLCSSDLLIIIHILKQPVEAPIKISKVPRIHPHYAKT